MYEDVLKEVSESYYQAIDQIAPDAPFSEVNRIFFTFVSEQEPYVEKMVCVPSYRDFAVKLFLITLSHNRHRYNPYHTYSQSEQHIINTFLALGSVNIYRRWVTDKKHVPLEKLIELTNHLFVNGIASIRKENS